MNEWLSSKEFEVEFEKLSSHMQKIVELGASQYAYRLQYNQRDDVREKRKLYNKKRNARIKRALKLLGKE